MTFLNDVSWPMLVGAAIGMSMQVFFSWMSHRISCSRSVGPSKGMMDALNRSILSQEALADKIDNINRDDPAASQRLREDVEELRHLSALLRA